MKTGIRMLMVLLMVLVSVASYAETVWFDFDGKIYKSVNGSAPKVAIKKTGFYLQSPSAIRYDSKVFVYFVATNKATDLMTISVWNSSSRTIKPLFEGNSLKSPVPSPNNRYVAFSTKPVGMRDRIEVFDKKTKEVWMPFPTLPEESQGDPSWSPDGKMIAYDVGVIIQDGSEWNENYRIWKGDPFEAGHPAWEIIPYTGGVGALCPSWNGRGIAYWDLQEEELNKSNISFFDLSNNISLTSDEFAIYRKPVATSRGIYAIKDDRNSTKLVRLAQGTAPEKIILSEVSIWDYSILY